MDWVKQAMSECRLCPRNCGVNRAAGQVGFCGQTMELKGARAALHFWEEPCISGTSGSGTVFFTGCNLGCVFCQNYDIAVGADGKAFPLERLTEIFFMLKQQGANNINLVTPTHFLPQICYALEKAKNKGLDIPVVYNSSGYEEVSSLRHLDGLVDIYLPDLKYFSPEVSTRFAKAPDYFEKASAALEEMFRQVKAPLFDEATGLLKRGMIVRHLLLPGQSADTKKILRYLHNTFQNQIYISIMNQYTPMPHLSKPPYDTAFADINRRITEKEYEKVLYFAEMIGIENGYLQEGDTASESFIPPFTYEGIET